MSTATTATAPPAIKRRLDYAPVPYTTKTVNLNISIRPGTTRVEGTLSLVRLYDPSSSPEAHPRPLVLDRGAAGVQTLVSVALDGVPLAEGSGYTATDSTLTIVPPPSSSEKFTLTLVVDVAAEANTSLEGLYKSGSAYCTQCEAEGFRNILPFQDRPDVMAVYTVRVEADLASCPVLLSNGNRVEGGPSAAVGRHYAVFHDPFPKPCYLFAAVAGDLARTGDSFTTASGKVVDLAIYTEARDAGKTAWAMESLKRSFRWDETAFGREYDLDVFSIVAVPDFNMGAMENKSLNIFNSRLVLSSPDTSSDADFGRIEGVVAHEYLHNWTGDRVTCRDWFQLTLKEGLTVYRDQEFSSDHNSRPVKRIEDVNRLRTAQFGEDAGPTAHPIRPDEVAKMDNFYSSTVYEKGAEVIRMYATLLGVGGFRRGMDLYFDRHDGHAVTCDDFFQAMYDANAGTPGREDLHALRVWYGQAGTPELTVTPVYDAAARTLTLTASQRTPATAGQATKSPVLIPIAVGLVGPDGADLPLTVRGQATAIAAGTMSTSTTAILRLTTAEASWVFEDVPAGTVPSILRNFSAPVRLRVVGQTDADLSFLFARDSDPFNRWEAGQTLGRRALLALYGTALAAAAQAASSAGSAPLADVVAAALDAAGGVPPSLAAAYASVLADPTLDGAFVARAVTLPAETEVVDALVAAGSTADPLVVHLTREYAVRGLARALRPQLEAAVAKADAAIAADSAGAGAGAGGHFSTAFPAVARRALRNRALLMLASLRDPAVVADLAARHAAATNMTDSIATLAALVDQPAAGTPERAAALAAFYETWREEPLVLLKWLTLQACACEAGTTEAVRALMAHPAFSITNPNACYSLLGAYAANAVPAFHALDGSGYRFLAGVVREVDAVNPQVAARLVGAFTKYRSYDAHRQALMRKELEGLSAGVDGGAPLSENVGEIVARCLGV
jgi:aminopeptidase N